MKNLEDFYRDLGQRESSGNYRAKNSSGYIGKYQMGEAAMVDAGYYKGDNNNYNNDWSGQFTGKDGIYSIDDFMNNPQAQENAQQSYKQAQWRYLQNAGTTKYLGKVIKGIEITPAAILAGAHLRGQNAVDEFIKSNGEIDRKDGNGVPVSEYMRKFQDYDVSNITGLNYKSSNSGTNNIEQEKLNKESSNFEPREFSESNQYDMDNLYKIGIEKNVDLSFINWDDLLVNPLKDSDGINNAVDIFNSNINGDTKYNPNAYEGEITGFTPPIEDSHIFTPEEIGQMTPEEFNKNEGIIMRQMENGQIQTNKPDYKNYENPISGKNTIYTREDIDKMSAKEYSKHENAIIKQMQTIGIPQANQLDKNTKTYGKEKASYSSDSEGKWVTIDGNHVLIKD